MVLSATDTGLVEDTRWWTNTNTVSYPTADIKRNLNKWYQELVGEILVSMDEWDVQGEIATASLVANQQEYTFPSDLLKIKRMEVTYDGSKWHRVTPMDVQETEEILSNQTDINNQFSTDQPRYDTHDNSVFLFPIPTSAVTNGMKIWYEKEPTELSANSDEPNIAEPFQRLLSIGASYDYAVLKGLPVANQLLQKLESGRARMREYYNNRVSDRVYGMGANMASYT